MSTVKRRFVTLGERKIARWKREEAKAKESRHAVYAWMLDANREGGVTYRELAQMTDLSEIRVSQVLRQQREQRGIE